MSFSSKLSDKDRAVINSIFNPHLPLGEVVNDEDLLDDDSKVLCFIIFIF